MDISFFGQTKISRLGFGCMRLPEKDGKIDRPLAQEMVEYALAKGINYLDTAYIYHDGESEIFLGQALKNFERSSYLLSDKLPLWLCHEPEDAPGIFAEQLKRLQTDYIDFYLLHSFEGNRRYDDVCRLKLADFCHKLKSEGRIRHLGFSYHGAPEDLERNFDLYDFEFVLLQTNYLDWRAQRAAQTASLLAQKEVALFVMEPLRGGGLLDLPQSAAAVLRAANPERSWPDWAFKWLAGLDPQPVTVLSGMSGLAQMQENIGIFADFDPLTEKEQQAVEKAVAQLMATPLLPCTACRYCEPCPSGVRIAQNFDTYNDYIRLPDLKRLRSNYSMLGEQYQAKNCTACGQCLEKCPQNIKIDRELAVLDNLVQSARE